VAVLAAGAFSIKNPAAKAVGFLIGPEFPANSGL